MKSIYTHQTSNVVKTYILMGLFLVIICFIGYFFSYTYGAPELFYAALLFSLIMNFVSYWFSDKIVLSISGAKEVRRDQFFDLYSLTENLSITAGLPMPKIYVIDDPAPNAFATGRDKKHSAIAVTTGLLQRLDRSELEGVIAHELSHVGNRDILLMSVVVVLVGLVSILSDFFLRSTFFGRRDNNRGGGILSVVGLVLIILSPIIATLIKLAISRRREYLADSSAALLTRYPEGLAKALEKISSYNSPMRHAHGATAHMYISNPFGKGGHFLAGLFSTHPPAEKRIAALRNMN